MNAPAFVLFLVRASFGIKDRRMVRLAGLRGNRLASGKPVIKVFARRP